MRRPALLVALSLALHLASAADTSDATLDFGYCVSRQGGLSDYDSNIDRFNAVTEFLRNTDIKTITWNQAGEPYLKHPMRVTLEGGRVGWLRVDGDKQHIRQTHWVDQGWSEVISFHLSALLNLGMVNPSVTRRFYLDPHPDRPQESPGTPVVFIRDRTKRTHAVFPAAIRAGSGEADTQCGEDSALSWAAFMRKHAALYLQREGKREFVDVTLAPTIHGVGLGKADGIGVVDGLSMGGIQNANPHWKETWRRVLAHDERWDSLERAERLELLDFIDVVLLDFLIQNPDRYRGKNFGYAIDGRLYAFDSGLGFWNGPHASCPALIRCHPYLTRTETEMSQYVLQGDEEISWCAGVCDDAVKQCRFRKSTVDRLRARTAEAAGLGGAVLDSLRAEVTSPVYPERQDKPAAFVAGLNERGLAVLRLVDECNAVFGVENVEIPDHEGPSERLVVTGVDSVNAGATFELRVTIAPGVDVDALLGDRALPLHVHVFDEAKYTREPVENDEPGAEGYWVMEAAVAGRSLVIGPFTAPESPTTLTILSKVPAHLVNEYGHWVGRKCVQVL